MYILPKAYTQIEFTDLIASTHWSSWVPKFLTLHNTGNPDLKTWTGYGSIVQKQWPGNLDRYYKSLGWHSGPHLVVCPDYIWNLCDLTQDGVSVSCWNHSTLGIEMVGDYDHDSFSTGLGAKVRDNTIHVLKTLNHKFSWTPTPLVLGQKGLHFHRMCTADHHHCPGDNVSLPEIIKLLEV